MLSWEMKYSFWPSKKSGVQLWHWTLQALHKQSYFCVRSPLAPNIIPCDLHWWQKYWLEPADTTIPPALTPGKQSKPNQTQAFSTVWNSALCCLGLSFSTSTSAYLIQTHTCWSYSLHSYLRSQPSSWCYSSSTRNSRLCTLATVT